MTDDREREKRIRYGFLIWIEEKNAEKKWWWGEKEGMLGIKLWEFFCMSMNASQKIK